METDEKFEEKINEKYIDLKFMENLTQLTLKMDFLLEKSRKTREQLILAVMQKHVAATHLPPTLAEKHYRPFWKAYMEAVKEGWKTVEFMGTTFSVPYAYYLLVYLRQVWLRQGYNTVYNYPMPHRPEFMEKHLMEKDDGTKKIEPESSAPQEG